MLEGQALAYRCIIGALLDVRFKGDPAGAKAEAELMSQTFDRVYGRNSMSQRGDEVMQIALHTIEELYKTAGD